MAAEAGTEIVAVLAAPVPIPIEVGHSFAVTLLSPACPKFRNQLPS
jgi:hypothetical protein